MKIIKDNKTYIQVKDLRHLKESNIALTKSIIFLTYLLFNNYNEYSDDDFICFEKDSSYFDDIDWIINFDDIKNLFKDEIIDICNNLIQERNNIANRYNNLSNTERLKNRYLLNKTKTIEYQINSYKDILKVMNGIKKLELPDYIEFPKGFIKENKVKYLIKNIRK